MTLLLLATLLLTSMGTLGYAWCVGDDGHVEVSYINGSGCCEEDLGQQFADQFDSPSISLASGDYCGLCLDFDAEQCEAVFFKRVKRSSMVSLEPFNSGHSFSKVMCSTKTASANLSRQSSFRVAQTILAQRTVVLLN